MSTCMAIVGAAGGPSARPVSPLSPRISVSPTQTGWDAYKEKKEKIERISINKWFETGKKMKKMTHRSGPGRLMLAVAPAILGLPGGGRREARFTHERKETQCDQQEYGGKINQTYLGLYRWVVSWYDPTRVGGALPSRKSRTHRDRHR